jgi:GntR family transcriptional regulator of abcA and norABC
MKAMDRNNSVLYLNSFTKSFSCYFRLGWIVAPKKIVSKILDIRKQNNGLYDLMTHAVGAELLKNGNYNRYLEELRAAMEPNRKQADEIAHTHLYELAKWNFYSFRFYGFVDFIPEVNVHKMYERRFERQVKFLPYYMFDSTFDNMIIISLTSVPMEQFEEYIIQLKELAESTLK